MAAGNRADATGIYTHLRDTCTKPSEGHVRNAAAGALAVAK